MNLAGGTTVLTCTYDKGDCKQDVFRWKSSNPAVATINYKGELVPKAEGTTDITVFYNGQLSEPVTFTVKDLTSYTIDVKEEKDASTVLTARSLKLIATIDGEPLSGYSWTVDESSTGKVELSYGTDNICTVTGKEAGTVKVNVSLTKDGKLYTGNFTLTVENRKELHIQVAGNKDKIYTNKSLNLSAVDADGKTVEGIRWTVTKGDATIDKDGVLTAGSTEGTVTVTAYCNDQYTNATLKDFPVVKNTIQIRNKADKETVTQIDVNEEINLEVVDIEGDPVAVTSWESSVGTAASVDTAGKLKGVSKSETPVTITAKATGFDDATMEVKVNNKSFVVKDEAGNELTSISMFAGNTMQLTAVDKATGKKLDAKWDILPYKVWATVSSTGLVTANTKTSSIPPTITVTVSGYDEVTLPVTVLDKGSFEKLMLGGSGDENTLVVNEGRQLIALDAENNAVKDVKWSLVGASKDVELKGDVLTVRSSGIANVTVRAEHSMFKTEDKVFNVIVVEPTGITVTGYPEDNTLIMGETRKLSITPVPANTSFPEKIVWSSEDPAVAEVVNGELQAREAGTTTLFAKYDGTEIGKFDLTVYATTQIVLDETMPTPPATLIAGEELVLKAYLMDSATKKQINADITWKLAKESDGDYCCLERNTLDTSSDLLGRRTIRLIATVDGTKYDAVSLPYEVVVVPRATAITLRVDGKKVNNKETVLNLNDEDQVQDGINIEAVIAPAEAGQEVVWQISDDLGIYESTETKAAMGVNATLNLKPSSAKRVGTITVKAVAKDGTKVFASTTVHFAKLGSSNLKGAPTVLRGGVSVDLRPYLDQDKNLTDKSVTWDIDNNMLKGKKIASINQNGRLTTKPVTQKTDITVKVKGSAGGFVPHTITLYPATKSIKVTSTELPGKTIELEKSKDRRQFQLDVSIKPQILEEDDVWPLIWSSTNENVATVDSDGVLTVKGAGKVRIDCMTTDGTRIKGSVNLKVTSTANEVTVTPSGRTLASGNSLNMKAVIKTPTGRKAANQKVTWSITDEFGNATSAAIVSATGRVTACDVDQNTVVVVTATSKENEDVFGSVQLTIKPNTTKTLHAIIDGDMISGSYAMNKGESVVVDAQWQRSGNGALKIAEDCQFLSSNTNVATIDKDVGTLKAVGYGSSTITLRCVDPATQNICTSTFTVKVVKKVGTVTINAPALRDLRSGKSVSLSATAWTDYANGTKADNQGFTWEVTENEKVTDVATINSNGVLTAKGVTKKHTVVVKAISKESGILDTATFNIFPAETVKFYFELSGKEYTGTLPVDLDTGLGGLKVRIHTAFANSKGNITDDDINSAGVTWSTSDKNVIQITTAGPRALKVGKATLTAKYKIGNTTYESKITAIVNRTMGSVAKIETSSILVAGKSINLRAVPANSNATNKNVLWSVEPGSYSDNVSINMYTGKLSAKKGIGGYTVTVKATPVDGSTPMSTNVYVFAATTKVEISDGTDVVTGTTVYAALSDGTVDFGAEAEPTEAYQTSFKWSSSDTSVATVSGDGKVTIKKVGATTIKAIAKDGTGKYAKFTLRVTN